MPWTTKQRQLAARACVAIRRSDAERRLMLRQLENAKFDEYGRPSDTPSSRSKRLTNADYERFMALVEAESHGQIQILNGDGSFLYAPDHWGKRWGDAFQRTRHHAEGIAAALERAGMLKPNGVGLKHWIANRVTGGNESPITELDYDELHALINGLRAFGRRHGVTVPTT